MTDLDKKKLEVRIKKAEAAMADLELRIQERLEDIKRMEEHIQLQKDSINECKRELEGQ